MKRLIYFFFAVAMMLPAAGCNDDPDFIKNAPPSSGETDGTDDDSDAGDDGTVEGVDPNFQIYLCFGQSNMEGFAQGDYNGIEDKDKTVDERFQVMNVVSGSWNGVQREVGHWYTAVPPLCRSNTGLCPADYFGRTMVEELSKTNPDIKVGVIVVAIGGASIRAFHKSEYASYYNEMKNDPESAWLANTMDIYGGNPYATLVDMARIAQKQGVIKGILMHQGESDACDAAWRQDVADIYNSLVADLSLKPESTPLLIGELLDDGQGHGNGVYKNSSFTEVRTLVPNAYVVSSEGCTVVDASIDPDNAGNNRYLHFSSEGYRELGRHYAQTMINILEKGGTSVPASNNHFDLAKLDADLESDPNPSGTSWNVETGELTTKANGIGGWKFETPIDLTVSNYLIVEFSEKPAVSGTRLAIYSDSYSVFDYSYTNGTIEGNMIVIDIKNGTFETSKYGVSEKKTLDLKNIKMLGIQTGGGGSVKIKRVYLDDKKPEIPDEQPLPAEELFKFEEGAFNPRLSGETAEFDYETRQITKIGASNVCGWQYSSPVNIKDRGYLVAKFSEVGENSPWLIIGNSNVWGSAFQAFGTSKPEGDEFWYSVIDLSQNLEATIGGEGIISLDKIQMIGFQSYGDAGTVSYKIEEVYFSPTNPLE